MERLRTKRQNSRYDRRQMPAAKHPLDTAIRNYLRTLDLNQTELAERIGRSTGWLNKYVNGTGKATIDDLIRIASAVLLNIEPPALNAAQRKLLRDWEALPPVARKQVKNFLAFWVERRHEPRSKSSARPEHKNHGTAGKLPGTR
jgi:transcriptional regulator with XRE-family HTH domain